MNIFENKFYSLFFYPVSLIYGLAVWLRNKCYDNNIFRSLKLQNCKVISVGNISAGGTGKTPVIIFLANYLRERGAKVAVLSRGYGRKSKGTVVVSDGRKILVEPDQAGDEPYLLARQLNHTPIVVEADRCKGALLIQERFAPEVILLDDGFQHRRLQRDLDIVLIDASGGLGNELLLPAGYLREPISSLKRADLIWLTHVDHSPNRDELIDRIHRVSPSPIITSSHQPVTIIQAHTHHKFEPLYLNQKRVFLFSGIAKPASFEQTVAELGARVVHHLKFQDHYSYRPKDVANIIKKAHDLKADLILTTEKDLARIITFIQNYPDIYFLAIEIRIGHEIDTLKNELTSIL